MPNCQNPLMPGILPICSQPLIFLSNQPDLLAVDIRQAAAAGHHQGVPQLTDQLPGIGRPPSLPPP